MRPAATLPRNREADPFQSIGGLFGHKYASRKSGVMLIACVCIALSACNPTATSNESAAGKEGADPNLECAALVGAANTLIVRGEVESDPAMAKRALVVSMTYLNAYAIPKGLKEAEAFSEVKSYRAELLEQLAPSDVMNRARQCIERSPL